MATLLYVESSPRKERSHSIKVANAFLEAYAGANPSDTIDRLVAHWLADRIGTTFGGRVAGVTRAGLFVKLDETGADGFVPIRTIGDEYFRHDEARHALVGRDTGATHRLGDAVEVRLVEVAPVAGALRFELLSEGRPAPTSKRAKPGRKPRKTKAKSGRPTKGEGRKKGRGKRR